MRQLDLFGSFFDTPSQDDKPGEQPVVPNKQAESANGADRNYSKNGLRSEATRNAGAMNDSPLMQPDESGEGFEPASVRLPVMPTLFDDLFAAEKQSLVVEQHIVETQVTAIVSALPEPPATVVANETFFASQKSGTEENPRDTLITEDPIETEGNPFGSLPEVKKKARSVKAPKPKIPELETAGSVIFDDGKITVKLKNRNPFPPPIVKEKKEKVKKLPQKRGRKSFKEIDAEVDLIDIPDDEILFQKQYYPISEVAKWFRVNTSLLRFWENEFDVLKPRKNRKGDRLFRPEDVKNLQLIYQLLRQRKYTIEGAKEYIKTNKRKVDIQLHLTNTLQKFKGFLLDLRANLQP